MAKKACSGNWICSFIAFAACVPLLDVATLYADESIQTVDYYVQHLSSTPAMDEQFAQLYVRERVHPSTLSGAKSLEGRVVLFISGSYIPSEVAFDLNAESYSWMAYLAAEGFDTFTMDITGHGRSTRPHAMNDPCNLSDDNRQAAGLSLESCEPSFPYRINTVDSEWADIDHVVDYIRKLRGVSKVSLVGWSTGGLRAGGFVARYPSKTDRLVLLAPSYTRSTPPEPPANQKEEAAMRAFTEAMQAKNWAQQTRCPAQHDPAIDKLVWSENLKSDPVGATWGTGTVRGPRTARWYWNKDAANSSRTPMLLIVGEHDNKSFINRAMELYEDSGAEEKVFVQIACASHFAQFESNRHLLFDASLQWLRNGSINGTRYGQIRIGD